jgi:hypothetical protein
MKIEDDLTDYLSCKIIFNKNKMKVWPQQPHLIKNLENKYGEAVGKPTFLSMMESLR